MVSAHLLSEFPQLMFSASHGPAKQKRSLQAFKETIYQIIPTCSREKLQDMHHHHHHHHHHHPCTSNTYSNPIRIQKNTVETKDASIQCMKLYRVSLYSGCPCILLTAFLLSNKCDFFCGVFLLPPFGRRARLEQQAAAGKIVASTAVHDGAVYVEGDNI